jgi:GT2 family glycosyltransferase
MPTVQQSVGDMKLEPKADGAVISVVIPFHNAAGTIEATLQALGTSDVLPDEVICVDDNSTDNGGIIVVAFSKRAPFTTVLLDQRPNRRGAASARNLGSIYANGDFLLFLDADVIVDKGATEHMLDCFLHRECIAVVALFGDHSAQLGFLSNFQAFAVNSVYRSIDPCNSPIMGSQCLLFRTKEFRATDGFDETYSTASVEDFALGYKLRGKGYKICVDESASIIHNHRYTLSSFSRNYFRKAKDLTLLMFKGNGISLKDTVYYNENRQGLLLLLLIISSALATTQYHPLYLVTLFLLLATVIALWVPFRRQIRYRYGLVSTFVFAMLRIYVLMLGTIGATAGLIVAFSRGLAKKSNR